MFSKNKTSKYFGVITKIAKVTLTNFQYKREGFVLETLEQKFITQKHYWSKLCQLKFDLIYYGKHFSRCVFWLRFIRIGTAVLTAAATGAWIEWNDIKWISLICPIAIFILQIINAGTELLPFDGRKLELRELIDALEPLYNKMEYDWQMIALGKYTNEEIEKLVFDYQDKKIELSKPFFKNDSLPSKKGITQKAKKEADEYLLSLK